MPYDLLFAVASGCAKKSSGGGVLGPIKGSFDSLRYRQFRIELDCRRAALNSKQRLFWKTPGVWLRTANYRVIQMVTCSLVALPLIQGWCSSNLYSALLKLTNHLRSTLQHFYRMIASITSYIQVFSPKRKIFKSRRSVSERGNVFHASLHSFNLETVN